MTGKWWEWLGGPEYVSRERFREMEAGIVHRLALLDQAVVHLRQRYDQMVAETATLRSRVEGVGAAVNAIYEQGTEHHKRMAALETLYMKRKKARKG